MMTKPDTRTLVILGGGGHAAVVAESARRAGWSLVAVFSGGAIDDPSPFGPAERLGDPLEPASVARIEALVAGGASLHAAVGDPGLRRRWHARYAGLAAFATIVDPGATVSPSATVAAGAFIGAGAIVQARAAVGACAIVNTRAVVEHDCTLADYTHISPGAILCGAVRVDEDAQVGAGAVVIPSRTVGARSVVGAGAVVTHDVAPGITAVGVPAHEIRHEIHR